MTSVSQQAEVLQQILEEEAIQLAKETGFIERERAFNGADFAQALILGWLQRADERLEGLVQILERREVSITASGLSQRFTPEAASFLQRLLERCAQVQLQAEAVEVPLLRRFSAVIVEDSSVVMLPAELAEVWQGCGGSSGTSAAAAKLFVRWDVLGGTLEGPRLTDGRHSDHQSPFNEEELPAGGLYLADLGFFSQQRLRRLAQRREGGKRFFVMRLQFGTGLFTRSGHQLELRGILPRREGEAKEMGVLLGKQAQLPVRLIMVRVSEEVATQRRERIREAAQDQGREPSAEVLYLAGWTIVVTNVPRAQLSLPEALVLLRLRWQIERLFRLWKEHGQIDEWRSKKPWRILCEFYGQAVCHAHPAVAHSGRVLARSLAQSGQSRPGRAPGGEPHHGRFVRRGAGTGVALHCTLYAVGLSHRAAQLPSQHRSTLIGGLRLATCLNLMPMGADLSAPTDGQIILLKVKIGSLHPEGGVIQWGEPRDAINRVPTIWTKYAHIFLPWRRILFILITLVGHRLRGKCYSASTSICAVPTPTTAARFAPAGSPMLRWPRRARL